MTYASEHYWRSHIFQTKFQYPLHRVFFITYYICQGHIHRQL